ncbi:hypothetical protein BDN72DRAFT_897469 [Pluteus cervinus]|uniref:Uncharacterized protein n=1 Tax=Pluteus cervinus TaxID=181527 RepID=A0ACD3AUY3_9AGAR|nr:hypothetical protein BDN72DRAFT_897469 [Pluteus cervinus]
MELFTPGGFRDFVRHSSGLFSRGMAGMSFSRSRRFIFVQAHVADLGGGPPKFTVLYVRQVIIQQLCLRGRATLVEKLGLLCYADSQAEAIHKTFLRLHDMPPSDLVDLPDELICRDLWVVDGSPSVGYVSARSMQNKFGVNKVIGFTKVEDTSQFFDGLDPRPWDILSASKSDGEQLQEIRIHFRSFSEVQAARRLVDAETPRQFITAVVHAMLGHFNLYEDRNILHCGISADTILITDDTIRDPMERFPLVGSKCQGILLGGETGHAEGSTDREVDTFGLRNTLVQYAQ